MRMVMESIVKFQKAFFERGISHLKPLRQRDVALDIGVSESTVSRAVKEKYAYTPQGLIPLKYFFSVGINKGFGGSIASTSVMEKIRRIIQTDLRQLKKIVQ